MGIDDFPSIPKNGRFHPTVFACEPLTRAHANDYVTRLWPDYVQDEEFIAKLHREYETLLQQPYCLRLSYTDQDKNIVAFLVVALINPKMAKALTSSPHHDIVPKIIAQQGFVKNDQELGKLNAEGSLVGCLLTFSTFLPKSHPDEPLLRMNLVDQILGFYKGLQIIELIAETHSETIYKLLLADGFNVVNSYDNSPNVKNANGQFTPKLMSLSRNQARNGNRYHLLNLFVSAIPKLNFTLVERELLQQALQGDTDEEAAEALSVSANTIKARWKSIYTKSQTILETENAFSSTRTKEKRRKVITYVQNHPEELRPFQT